MQTHASNIPQIPGRIKDSGTQTNVIMSASPHKSALIFGLRLGLPAAEFAAIQRCVAIALQLADTARRCDDKHAALQSRALRRPLSYLMAKNQPERDYSATRLITDTASLNAVMRNLR